MAGEHGDYAALRMDKAAKNDLKLEKLGLYQRTTCDGSQSGVPATAAPSKPSAGQQPAGKQRFAPDAAKPQGHFWSLVGGGGASKVAQAKHSKKKMIPLC